MLPTMFFLNDQQGAGASLARDREGTRGQDHGDAGEWPDQESGQGVNQLESESVSSSGKWTRCAAVRK